ncbi:MAG: serine/threonine protein kinase [Clostridiales bacterium]|nr:serine/threonine protein kinase [Clostridiales bacterium]MCD7803107.1 serine/threonine protein kinase [Clostridiales bacterium]
MTEIGTVIDGKYEVLREIGRGGMSIVYLAMDTHLNKQWAVKEIRKKGSGKNDEIVVNSLLAEANLMKRLDHPSLPRIVDIIDNGVTIYVVMDYIEGESLDKILNEYGAQPEELVVGWAKQLCDALGYLHSQKPPIIYRDMKPANIMLKPEGNIKIIDFGIAREYKEQNLSDTTVLGTKGYAPPEQYSGQTDPRSDIFALGMTMHHLLTGIDPRSGEAYAPVRQWNPELSEGIEIIINRCVEPAAENRYQSCSDLLYDLEHPELITRGFKKKQRRKLGAFIAAVSLCVVMTVAGIGFNLAATAVNNQDYDSNLSGSDPESYYAAVEIYPGRVEAYDLLIEYYKNHDATNEQITRVGNTIEANADALDLSDGEIADMFYDMGKFYFSEYDGSFKSRAVSAKSFFKAAAESEADFDKKEIAECYYAICSFMTDQSTTSEHSLDDYTALFDEIETAMDTVDRATDSEANYDKITLYYVGMLLINDQAEYMAGVEFDRQTALELMDTLNQKASAITSTLSYVNDLKDKIQSSYSDFVSNINAKYDEVEKRRQGAN